MFLYACLTAQAAAKPEPWTYRALLAPSARYVATFVMAASFVFPVGGLGIDLCLLHAFTGLPCPGCGMTRAIAALSHGQLLTALQLHPFALLAWPTFLVLALATLGGRRGVARFEGWVSRHSRGVASLYQIAFFGFLAFGAGRLILFLSLGERFP